MEATHIGIFDDGLGIWGPLCDLRPVFELRTGAWPTRQRLRKLLGEADYFAQVPWESETLAGDVVDWPINPRVPAEGSILWVSGRWSGLGPPSLVEQILKLPVGTALVQDDHQIVAAHLAPQHSGPFRDGNCCALPESVARETLGEHVLLTRPWHILDNLMDLLALDMTLIDLPRFDPGKYPGVYYSSRYPIKVGAAANLAATCCLRAERGPIIIDNHASIEPMCVIDGPCYIGAGSSVHPHAWLRPGCAIGPGCSVGGEVNRSILAGYCNKAHAGYLGDAIVGQWANLGSGTIVSNLKNTWGDVRMQLDAKALPEDTGRTKLGPIFGDFVHTGIGSRIMTGTVIGTGAMIALSGFVSRYVPPLTFNTDRGSEAYNVDRFNKMARTVLGKRGQDFTRSMAQRIELLAERGRV